MISQAGNTGHDRQNRLRNGSGSIGYRALYRLGITPWDRGQMSPELVELVEGADSLPPGRALDLGCGPGRQAIYLAQHGWQVTGVDYVARALETARRRAADAGVAPAWVQGNVTQLDDLGIGTGFGLLLDYGCFHGLTDDQRDAYAAGVATVAAPGATFLLNVFAPGRRGPAPRGASREEIERRFGGAWEVVWARKADWLPLPGPLRNANPSTYRLRRL